MEALLIRNYKEDRTTGTLYLLGRHTTLKLHTLELPDRNNQRNISCIQKVRYIVNKWKSPKHGDCYLISGVPNRTMILIHKGNLINETQGCILVGMTTDDKNVYLSKKALDLMLANTEHFNLHII